MAKKYELTPRQLRFCAEFPKDENRTHAAIRAGYAEAGAHVTGHRLLKLPKIQAYLKKTRDKMALQAERTVAGVDTMYQRAYDLAMELKQPAAATAAARGIARLYGLDVDVKAGSELDIELSAKQKALAAEIVRAAYKPDGPRLKQA